jgi:UDP-N-acetyl-D-galactosamine dehydrogenase
MLKKNILKIGIIGLGYVGLPILLSLKKKFFCVGYDINTKRIKELQNCYDSNKEFKSKELSLSKSIYSNNYKDLKECNFYIVTVPTPIYKNKSPDLRPLHSAGEILKKVIENDDIVFFESTVYPGLTRALKKKFLNHKKIWIGYSPERINPGDKINTVTKIKKIVSFDNCPKKIKNKIIKVYKSITKNLVLSNSIENAEMSKVIENIQRDINIAFMNEIFMVSKKLNLDFKEIIKLAKTKWNFLNFLPGLVGGHCLPIDPFYLYYLAKKKKHNAQFMLAGRRVNDELADFVKIKIINLIKLKKLKKILILGLSYKSNVADLRNSLAFKIYKDLKKQFSNKIFAYDPVINNDDAKKLNIISKMKLINKYDLYVSLTNHKKIKKLFLGHYKKNKLKYLDYFNHFNK